MQHGGVERTQLRRQRFVVHVFSPPKVFDEHLSVDGTMMDVWASHDALCAKAWRARTHPKQAQAKMWASLCPPESGCWRLDVRRRPTLGKHALGEMRGADKEGVIDAHTTQVA